MKKSELTENQIPTPVKGENNNRKKLPASERLCFTDGMCGCCSDGFRRSSRSQTVLTGRKEFMRQQSTVNSAYEGAGYELPSGIAGVASGVNELRLQE